MIHIYNIIQYRMHIYSMSLLLLLSQTFVLENKTVWCLRAQDCVVLRAQDCVELRAQDFLVLRRYNVTTYSRSPFLPCTSACNSKALGFFGA